MQVVHSGNRRFAWDFKAKVTTLCKTPAPDVQAGGQCVAAVKKAVLCEIDMQNGKMQGNSGGYVKSFVFNSRFLAMA